MLAVDVCFGKPDRSKRGFAAQVVYVPVRACRSAHMMPQPPSQAAWPARAADINIIPRRKTAKPQTANLDNLRSLKRQNERINSPHRRNEKMLEIIVQ